MNEKHKVLRRKLTRLNDAGFDFLNVFDGEETHKTATLFQVMEVATAVDECTITLAAPEGEGEVNLLVIWDVDPEDIIADHGAYTFEMLERVEQIMDGGD